MMYVEWTDLVIILSANAAAVLGIARLCGANKRAELSRHWSNELRPPSLVEQDAHAIVQGTLDRE